MTQNPSHDSSSLSRDEDKRLRELAEALQLDVQDFTGEWDAFTAVFTVADGLDGDAVLLGVLQLGPGAGAGGS